MGEVGNVVSHNMYAYGANNPVMNVDPSGTFVSTIIGAVTGAIAGALTALATGGDLWTNIGYGALTGALAGLVVDVSVVTGGVGGLLIAGIGGMFIGTASDVVGQMWLDGKTWEEVDKGRAFASGALTGALNMVSFGIGRILSSGQKFSGNLFQKLTQSFLKSGVTDWLAQAMIALPSSLLGSIPTLISSRHEEIPEDAVIIDQYAISG